MPVVPTPGPDAPLPGDCGVPSALCAPFLFADDLDELGCSPQGFDPSSEDDLELMDKALVWASERFVDATRGMFSPCCPVTLLPPACGRACPPARHTPDRSQLTDTGWPGGVPSWPIQVNTDPAPLFLNSWSCRCNDLCQCVTESQLHLPLLPVRDVVEVVIDGEVLDPAAYLLVPGTNIVIRTDGLSWPLSNDWSQSAGVGTWSVTFRHGLGVPAGGLVLLAKYAWELAKSCRNEACDLPDGVRVISRPGIEYMVLDYEYREHGLTGYVPLDDWIVASRGGSGRATTRPRLWTGRRNRPSRRA